MSQNSIHKSDEMVREHRALAIMKLLNRSMQYQSNSYFIKGWLSEIGLAVERDELDNQLNQLEITGAIKQVSVDGVNVVELQEKGQEIALGLITIDGVAKPTPECPY